MAHLNWRPGMWPAGGGSHEFAGWDGYPNPMLAHLGVVGGPIKRTPSNLSMSAVPDSWMQQGQPMMHPMMYPPHFHPSMMYLTGSQTHLAGGPMMMNPMAHPQQFEQRPSSPASSQRSRRSHRSSQKSSSQNQRQRSSAKHWSESDDERFSGESDDSMQDRPMSPRKPSSNSSRRGSKSSKDYGPVRPLPGRKAKSPPKSNSSTTKTAVASKSADGSWECDHCTFVNAPGTRICAVCCRTSSQFLQKQDSTAEEDEDLPVVKCNLSFNIKDDHKGGDSTGLQVKNEQLILKEKSPAKEPDVIAKNYEDVSNMLKRMQVRKKDNEALYKSPLEDEIDAIEDDDIDLFGDDEEGYIEMEDKDPLYERVQYPFNAPSPTSAASVSAGGAENCQPTVEATGQGNFTTIDEYLRAAERSIRRARFQD